MCHEFYSLTCNYFFYLKINIEINKLSGGLDKDQGLQDLIRARLNCGVGGMVRHQLI